MKFLLPFLICLSCVAQGIMPPNVPSPPRNTAHVKQATLLLASSSAVAETQLLPVTNCIVSWSASPSPGVLYQVWTTANLAQPFALAATTTNLSWTSVSTNAEGFFAVRAINAEGIPSAWAK